MTTYHWLSGSDSRNGVLFGTALPPITLTIPANGILKRFQLRESIIMSQQSGRDITSISPWGMEAVVTFFDFAGVPRTIYQSVRAVPQSIAALYDPATLERIYTQQSLAGDGELGVNQGCSYGKHTDPATKRVQLSFQFTGQITGTTTVPTGYIQFSLAALYLTLP